MLTLFIVVLLIGGGIFLYAVMKAGEQDQYGGGTPGPVSDRSCPACHGALPARKADRDRHLERHVVQYGAQRTPAFTWKCEDQCEPEMVWTNSYAAALGLAQHFHKRHGIMPVLR